MIRKIERFVLLLCLAATTLAAQDPAERAYLVPALNPQHKDKSKVTGWAKQRIEEKINRGMLAIVNESGKVYLGWRLLKSDPDATSFNVYRSIEHGNPVKLNNAPLAVTTDFIDEQPALSRESAYWVRPVGAGKELAPSEKAHLQMDSQNRAIETTQRTDKL